MVFYLFEFYRAEMINSLGGGEKLLSQTFNKENH